MVELHYFLPLHTLLIGIYARLFATASNIAGSLNLDMGYILAGRSSSRPRRPQKRRIEKQRSEPTDGVATEMIVGGMEIGTKIARPLIVVDPVPVPSSSPVIVASSSAGDDVEIVPSVEESGIPHDLNPHNPEPAQCTHANDDINRENRPQPEAAKPSRPGRKRRTDEMDDIFGF